MTSKVVTCTLPTTSQNFGSIRREFNLIVQASPAQATVKGSTKKTLSHGHTSSEFRILQIFLSVDSRGIRIRDAHSDASVVSFKFLDIASLSVLDCSDKESTLI